MSNEVMEISELVENHTDDEIVKAGKLMPNEVAEISELVENHAKDDALVEHDKAMSSNGHEDGNHVVKVNGLNESGNEDLDWEQLVKMIVELNSQNEYLKAQFEGFNNKVEREKREVREENVAAGDVKEMQEKIVSLSKELSEEKQMRGAAEEALKHLRAVYEEADAKALVLSAKLSEAQQRMDQEIKERDEKYTELDSKFNRLHKRAKQRIQDVQKEKDDLEARLRDVTETAEQASAQKSSLQKELERTRQQANEALKAMDLERQQLRSANNKLRDEIDELRQSLQPKEHALEALQQSLTEKDQMLEEIRGSLQAVDEKRQASMAELSAKHQRNIESLEGQLADALSDRNKAAETIASLQVLLVEKESKIAEMDAASTGEAARLKAAMETLKVELIHQKNEHDKEKEIWESATEALKEKLEVAEGNCIRAEIEAAKMRSQLEYEVSVQTQLLNTKVSELTAAKEEINLLENEFSSYKHRAHALLQKKDAELVAAKDSEQLKALEEAFKESEKEIILAMSERDRAIQDLESALSNHDKELASRDEALRTMKQQLRSLEAKLDSACARHQSEKEAWETDIKNLEETWRLRCETLKIEKEVSSGQDLQKDLEELRLQNKRLKEENDSFRDLADRIIGEKDTEISKLIDDNKNLRRSLEMRPTVNDDYNSGFQKQDAPNLNASAAEQQILILARRQAQREEELAQSQRHILALQEEIEELDRENRLHSQQEAMLKAEMRNMERSQKREGVDLTYLKNVILKLLETGEVEALLPVIGMLLQFSPEEIQKCQQAYHASAEVPPSPASNSSGSSYSLFSRFSFS